MMARMLLLCMLLVVISCDGQDPATQSTRDVVKGNAVEGWLGWRGPDQTGMSQETGLFDTVALDGENHLWTYAVSGRGTPVIAGEKLYTMGYRGEGPDLQELLVCLNAETGELIWEHGFSDFISDIIYYRYAIGSPTIDGETGNVYVLTTTGIMACFDAAGQMLWQHSMMEEFGRLTFPNGRTGAPVIDGDLVITRGITSNWGAQGPARDRFYAFDKFSGDLVWSSTPGVQPTDSSFSTPVLAWFEGKRVFYCGTGCGNIVCVNARTGENLWRYQFLRGGINSSVLLYGNDKVIAIHGKENVDSSEIGRMVCLNADLTLGEPAGGQVVLDKRAEAWRAGLSMFTSSPVLVDGRVYQVVHAGVLHCLDAETGAMLWEKKLSNSQLHASPLYADGKLYVPIVNGLFYVLRPTDAGAEELCKVQLEGNALGSPSVWNGKVYVHTTEQLYCFGKAGDNPGRPQHVSVKASQGKGQTASRLQIVPSEVLMRPGDEQDFQVLGLDGTGHKVSRFPSANAEWEKYIPPTAKVRVRMNGDFGAGGVLTAGAENVPSAGAYRATIGELQGTIRGRVLPKLPYGQDFEAYDLVEKHPTETDVQFAYPPLPWIGARFKWEVREREGTKVLAKTLDRVLFQRALTFLGHPDMKDYTVEADLLSDGNRRGMSDLGLINQRYIIAIKGNQQLLEVSSNHALVKVSVPFAWKTKQWYRLKTRVDLAEDGSGVVRAKAWPRDEAEPAEWTIEVDHERAHQNGSPGLFGFSPQSKFRVYIDNVSVTPNNQ